MAAGIMTSEICATLLGLNLILGTWIVSVSGAVASLATGVFLIVVSSMAGLWPLIAWLLRKAHTSWSGGGRRGGLTQDRGRGGLTQDGVGSHQGVCVSAQVETQGTGRGTRSWKHQCRSRRPRNITEHRSGKVTWASGGGAGGEALRLDDA